MHLTDEALAGSDVNGTGYALAKVLEAEAPDLVLLGQQSDDGECYTIGAVVADHLADAVAHAGDQDRRRGRRLRCERQAEYGYDTVLGRAPGRDLRRRRDQRAALPVAEGDHGRQEEAAGDQVGGRRRASRPIASASSNARAHCSDFAAPPAKSAGQIIEDEDTNETVEKIVAWLDERKLLA